MNELARNTKGHWVATHMGQRVTFTEQRFGEAAELLARRALLAMQAGTYNGLRDNSLLKLYYSRDLAAKVLGIHVGELNKWLLSGVLRGREITPPRSDDRKGAKKICGFQLAIVQERMRMVFGLAEFDGENHD